MKSHPGVAARMFETLAAADLAILPITGPEVVTGSTRMKAGTATKLVLNTITTGAMIRLGKTYGNLMVDLKATNAKLVKRALALTVRASGAPEAEAQAALDACQSRRPPGGVATGGGSCSVTR